MKGATYGTGYLILLVLSAPFMGVHDAGATFTVVALPDTQYYSDNLTPEQSTMPVDPVKYPTGLAPIFAAQTQWIVDNRDALNIRFVCHLGDMVEHGPDVNEWAIANAAMQILDEASIPYGTCLGNHDNHYGYLTGSYDFNTPDMDPNAVNYINHFCCARFAGRLWYKGTSPSRKSNYQIIEADGYEFLFLNLSIDTPRPELDWAEQVLDQNRDKLVILSTHRYLYDFRIIEGYYGDGILGQDTYQETGLVDGWYDLDGVWPKELFETFVRTHKNIFLVLCGHCHGQYYQVSQNNWDLPVAEVLTDYQDEPNGGNGWLRLMEFDMEAGKIDFSTYSPTEQRSRSVADDFIQTILMINAYKYMLAYTLGWSSTEADVLEAQFAGDIPGYENPLMVEQAMALPTTQALLQQNGIDPSLPWEGLWMLVFADGHRNPNFTLEFDFDAYLASDETSP
jgi:hypothetical protein